jgi:FkbM family methyltransferase
MDYLKYLEKIYRKIRKDVVIPGTIRLFRYSLFGIKFYITNSVEAYRVLNYGGEEDFTNQILNELRKEDVFFDIGACLGLVSLHAAKRCKQVYAFEPDPDLQKHLIHNITLNNVTNINVIQWAVMDLIGKVNLFTNGTDGPSPSILNNANRIKISVEAKNIDHAIRKKELPFPNIMKLDVEGAEYFALIGMKNLLVSNNAPRKIFIEIHPTFLYEFKVTGEEIKNILESVGYKEIFKNQRGDQYHCIYRKEFSSK